MTAEREGLAEEIEGVVLSVLEMSAHAPMSEHDPRMGECLSCPWPLHEAESPEGMAHAIADALADLLAARDRRVRGEALREAAEEMLADLPEQRMTVAHAWADAARWLRGRADRIEAP